MNEKAVPEPRRFSAVGCCLAGLRVWQWSSAFFVWASWSLLYDHIKANRLGENGRMKGVQILGLVSLVYATLIICCVHIPKTLGLRIWRVFAMCSLPGDLTMMGIYIAKISILAFSGLPADCHGLTRTTYDGNDMVRQPADGYNTIRFGSWALGMPGELDQLCTLPRTVYGLSVFAIFSYTFSLLLSVLQLQQPRSKHLLLQQLRDEEAGRQGTSSTHTSSSSDSHHPIMLAPSILDPTDGNPLGSSRSILSPSPYDGRLPPRSPSPHPATQGSTTRTSRAPSISSSRGSQTSEWGGASTTLVNSSTRSSDTDSVTLGPCGLAGPPLRPRRWSTSTSSSYDANGFLVTDGFRPEGSGSSADLPEYCSRPGSLYHEPMKYAAGLGMPGTRKP